MTATIRYPLALSLVLALYSTSAMAGNSCSMSSIDGAMDKREVLALPPALATLHSAQETRRAARAVSATQHVDRVDMQKFAGAAPPGTWDDVDGYFTFSWFYPEFGELDLLIRGFPATRIGSTNEYRVEDWDRSAYWLEVTGHPPRLLQSLELTADFVPQPGELFSDNQDVVDTCTPGANCTVNFVAYFRYRQSEAPAGTWQDLGGAFVTDGNGDAIDFILFIEDAQGQVSGNERLTEGDEIQLNLLAYRMSEPEYIYGFEYMPFVALAPGTTAIRRANYVPGVSFTDPALPPDLNAANEEIRLVLDASSGAGTGFQDGGPRPGTFAYGGPYRLGFTWGQAQDFLHRGSFEPRVATPQAPPLPLLVHPAGK